MYQQILVKCPNTKFHGNLFRDSVLVRSRQKNRYGSTDRCITTTFHCEQTKKVSTKFGEVQSLFRSIKASGSKLNRWKRMKMTYKNVGITV